MTPAELDAVRALLAQVIGRCIWPAEDNGATPTSAPEDAGEGGGG